MNIPKMKLLPLIILIFSSFQSTGQTRYLLQGSKVFDGTDMHEDWTVLVEDQMITYAGPQKSFNDVEIIDLRDYTLLPGLIEGHSHILLHPYDEVNWNDQVLKESYGERAARAVVHVEKSLKAGITTMRDLGSEGAGYLDVEIRNSIEKGIIPGPSLLVAGPAIVATGSYGPKGFHSGVQVPLGAQTADGNQLITVVREQIGKGADFIKVYADYRWGPNREAMPTFSLDELKLIVETAKSSGRVTVAHASTSEGMKRAILAGVKTIEHGDELTDEVADLMKSNNVTLYPTLAAVESISQYLGWKKGIDDEPARVTNKKRAFKKALDKGLSIGFGGDVGVFPHGENVLELELMVDYGMTPIKALRSATSLNASVFDLKNKGVLNTSGIADIIAIEGDPSEDISTLRNIVFVMKSGKIVFQKTRLSD